MMCLYLSRQERKSAFVDELEGEKPLHPLLCISSDLIVTTVARLL